MPVLLRASPSVRLHLMARLRSAETRATGQQVRFRQALAHQALVGDLPLMREVEVQTPAGPRQGVAAVLT